MRGICQTFGQQITQDGSALQNQTGNGFSGFSIAVHGNNQARHETGDCNPQLAAGQLTNDKFLVHK